MFAKLTNRQMAMMAGGSAALVAVVFKYFNAQNLPTLPVYDGS